MCRVYPLFTQLQSRTKLLEKVFPFMSTFLRNKTISKTKPLRKGRFRVIPASFSSAVVRYIVLY